MKKLFLAVWIIAIASKAQNYSVSFQGNPVGYPTNWPFWSTPIGTNTVVTPPNVLMTFSQLTNCYATNLDAFNAFYSNNNYQATLIANSNYTAWYGIYTNLPSGIADSTTRTNNAWKDYNSFISGTNTAAGTNSIIKNALLDRYVGFIYERQLLDYLNKLGPGIQRVFDPSGTPAQ